jgi:hypothetical protein
VDQDFQTDLNPKERWPARIHVRVCLAAQACPAQCRAGRKRKRTAKAPRSQDPLPGPNGQKIVEADANSSTLPTAAIIQARRRVFHRALSPGHRESNRGASGATDPHVRHRLLLPPHAHTRRKARRDRAH